MDRLIPSGDVKVSEALFFMILLCLSALLLVITTNFNTVLLAFLGATLAGIYPCYENYAPLGMQTSRNIFFSYIFRHVYSIK